MTQITQNCCTKPSDTNKNSLHFTAITLNGVLSVNDRENSPQFEATSLPQPMKTYTLHHFQALL